MYTNYLGWKLNIVSTIMEKEINIDRIEIENVLFLRNTFHFNG